MSEQNNQQLDLSQLTPEQLEQAMLEKEKSGASEGSLLDSHAAMCHMYYPVMRRYLKVLNKKAIERVIELVAKFPIEDSDKKPLDKKEQELFNILNQILTSKYIMIIHSAGEELAKIEEAKKTKEGENNGKV